MLRLFEYTRVGIMNWLTKALVAQVSEASFALIS